MVDWHYSLSSTDAYQARMRDLLAEAEESRRARLVRRPRQLRRRIGLALISWGIALLPQAPEAACTPRPKAG